MKKTFVLDTNVLLYDPEAIFNFEDNEVVIPISVIEELDDKKHLSDTIGRNARQVSRYLDKLREQTPLDEGVLLDNGGTLLIELAESEYIKRLSEDFEDKRDNRILAVAFNRLEQCSPDCISENCDDCENEDSNVILVSKDTNVRIKANAIGIIAQDYETDKVDISDLYTGTREIYVTSDVILKFFNDEFGSIDPPSDIQLYPNECITIINECDIKNTVLARYDEKAKRLFRISDITTSDAPSGLIPRNREQRFALDLLLDDNIKLVTLIGKAGTGKTLLAIAAGLHKVTSEEVYRRLLVARPVTPLGKQDIGFLPGTIEEKIGPWMQPIYDNIEVLMSIADPGCEDKRAAKQNPVDELTEWGYLEVEPLTYIRGRSIPRQYMIIDEAQNLTPHEVKTIITRAGEDTKIVLTGDPYQIDNPYVNSDSNGLTYTVERMKHFDISGHVTLTKGERSLLAKLASEVL